MTALGLNTFTTSPHVEKTMWLPVLLLLTLLYFAYVQRKRETKKKPPGLPSFPLIGSIPYILPYLGRTQEFAKDMCAKYGPVFGFQFGSQYFAFIDDHEICQKVMTSDDWINRLNDHPMHFERSFGQPLGLIAGFGEGWKEIRRFTTRSLRLFGFGKGSMEGSIDFELTELIQRLETSITSKDGVDQVMQKFFQIPSTNILWSMVAGFRFSYEDAKLRKILKLADTVSKELRLGYSPMYAYPFLRFIPWLTERDSLLKLHTEIKAIIKEIMEERRASRSYEHQPSDVIEVYLKEIEERKLAETKNPGMNANEINYFTDEQLIMVGTDLFITGIDSTSTALEFAILYMILNQDVQKRIQDEIDEVIGPDRRPTLQDKPNMPYTEATTLEILRFASNLPMTLRSPSVDVKVNDFYIPKGTLVGLNLQSIHYSSKIWEDPEVFRPERFLNENMNIINQDKIMPFGYGKRVCMGEVLARSTFFKFFTTLLQKFTFERSPTYPKLTTKPIFGFNQFPKRYSSLIKIRNPAP